MATKAQDLTGKRFGKLTVRCLHKNIRGVYSWVCDCDCGGEKIAVTGNLNGGNVTSCGCSRIKNISGERFGRLLAIKPAGKRGGEIVWECICDCGNTAIVRGSLLRGGNTLSCGCIHDYIRYMKSNKVRGKDHPRWNDEITDEDRRLRRIRHKDNEFKFAVAKKYGNKCVLCGTWKDPQVHHLDGFHWCKEGRDDIDNAVILCKKCHTNFHHFYGRGSNTAEQFYEYENTMYTYGGGWQW